MCSCREKLCKLVCQAVRLGMDKEDQCNSLHIEIAAKLGQAPLVLSYRPEMQEFENGC